MVPMRWQQGRAKSLADGPLPGHVSQHGGLTAENLAKKYSITREQADAFSLASHQKALAGRDCCRQIQGRDCPGRSPYHHLLANGDGRAPRAKTSTCDLRYRRRPAALMASMEALAKLKPAFHAPGTVTAGNSSQMSDGAAASVVMSAERARVRWAWRRSRAFVALPRPVATPEEMGLGPVYAILEVLKDRRLDNGPARRDRNSTKPLLPNLFPVIKVAWVLDPARINVNGAIALGHPPRLHWRQAHGHHLALTRSVAKRAYGLVTMRHRRRHGRAAGIFERAA